MGRREKRGKVGKKKQEERRPIGRRQKGKGRQKIIIKKTVGQGWRKGQRHSQATRHTHGKDKEVHLRLARPN